MELKRREVTRLVTRPLTVVRGVDGWLLTVACAVTAFLYAGCFSTSSYLAPVALAALGGGLVASLCTWRRFTTRWAVGLGALGNLVYVVTYVLLPTWRSGLPTSATLTALREGVVGGWLRLLTTSTPVDVTPMLLVFPVVVSWWCGWSVQQLAARGRRVLLPVLPALVALNVALLYGAAGLRDRSWVAIVWATCVVLAVLVRANRPVPPPENVVPSTTSIGSHLESQRQRAALGQLGFGLPTAVIAVVAALALSVAIPLASGADRFDPRALVAQPFHVSPSITPLATIQGQLATTPAEPLFAIKERGPRIDRVRVAVLDSFDGFTWTAPRDTYVPAGHVLTSDDLVQDGRTVTLGVRVIGSPQAPFLPVIGEPTGLRSSGLGVSDTGSLAASSPPRPGLGYELTSLLRPADDLASDARIVTSDRVANDLALPTPPPALVQTTGRIVQRASTPYEKLRVLAAYLTALPNDPNARAGHSYGAITRMLVKAKPGDEAGFAEQHAAAFVVMARILGLPARVAVGYRVDGQALADGKEVTVRTSDAHAWAEVPIEGYGWVPFETLDLTSTHVTAPSDPVIPALSGGGTSGPNSTGGAAGEGEGSGGPAATLARHTVTGLGILLAALVAYVLLVVAEKRRRRWSRRRSPEPAARISGAWLEARDRLIEHGVRVGRDWTADEAALRAHASLGAPAAASTALAMVVNEAWYAPEQPSELRANDAWELSRQLGRDLAASRRRVRRQLAVLDPRPMLPAWLAERIGRPGRGESC